MAYCKGKDRNLKKSSEVNERKTEFNSGHATRDVLRGSGGKPEGGAMVRLGEEKADEEVQMGLPQHGRSPKALSVHHHEDHCLCSWGGSPFSPFSCDDLESLAVQKSLSQTFILFNIVLCTTFTYTSYHPASTYWENETEDSGDFSDQAVNKEWTKEVMVSSILLNP